MTNLKDISHFQYGNGFWYADPINEIKGLTEEQLYWIPSSNSMCTLWHIGHIAHRERYHIGYFLQGIKNNLITPKYEVFGPEWCSLKKLQKTIKSVKDVFSWVKDVRQNSHKYIESLTDEDYFSIPQTSEENLSVAHWLYITAAHTALHIGRIQLLRSIIENTKERAC